MRIRWGRRQWFNPIRRITRHRRRTLSGITRRRRRSFSPITRRHRRRPLSRVGRFASGGWLAAVAVGAAALAALVGVYARLLRQPIVTWGATEDEATRRLPGDELLLDADGVATRAITIDAPTSAVWPWIAQMGPSPRGGAYTYDWIENLLGLQMHSANEVLPEFQHPEIGDGFGFGANRMSYAIVEPEHVLAMRSADGNWVWTFILEDRRGQTRLVSRNRFRLPHLKDRIGMIPMEAGSLVMERKMLQGIKERAERLARRDPVRPDRERARPT